MFDKGLVRRKKESFELREEGCYIPRLKIENSNLQRHQMALEVHRKIFLFMPLDWFGSVVSQLKHNGCKMETCKLYSIRGRN